MKLPKLYAFNKKLKIDLSLSENPLGCSPKVFSALKKDIKKVTKYPDPTSSIFISILTKNFKVSKKQILLGNGSESLIDLICRVLIKPKEEVILPEVTFPLFERAILLVRGKPVFVKMKRDFQVNLPALKRKLNKQVRLFIICNPNNSTGKIIIGVLFGPKKIIEKFKQFSQPFALNSFAEKAGIEALKDKKFIDKTQTFMSQEREFMVFNSEANNILVEVNRIFPSATKFVKLLNENNVSVVNGKSFRGLGDQFIRVSPRTRKTNLAFIRVIDKLLTNVE